jgi:LPS-assembly protein
VLRLSLLASCTLAVATPASGQDLQQQPEPAAPAPAVDDPQPADPKLVQFSADTLEYDENADLVTASGEVRMTRDGNRLRADKVVWNRRTGEVVASGGVAVASPQGDFAYGDSIELTDSLKGGVVDNMLVVLDRGGRFAAARGRREEDGTLRLDRAAYTPCPVTSTAGCPKEPSWKITAVRVTYRPDRERIYFVGGRFHLLGLPSLPLPRLSVPVGGASDSGLLSPNVRFNGINGLELNVPYYLALAPNRGLTLTPHVYSRVLPMAQVQYDALGQRGAFRVTGYATVSRRSDDLSTIVATSTEQAFRGYLDGIARYQLSPHWTPAARCAARRTERSCAATRSHETTACARPRGWSGSTLTVTSR